MSIKQTKTWYWILIGELLFASFVLLILSFYAEALGIDSGGQWGVKRLFVAALGIVLGILPIVLCIPRIRTVTQTTQIAQFIRYITEAPMWFLAALGLCELILQIAVSRSPTKVYEKDWGIVPIPGSFQFWGKEGFARTHYLAHGEIVTPAKKGDISVVVLGDSNTEALQVPDEVKFVSLAEANIRSRGKAVDLHNLGMSGNSIPDYIYFAPVIKRYYDPRIVVIQLSPQDFYGGDGGDSFNPEHRNYFIVDDGGELELRHQNQQYASGLYGTLASKSMFFALGYERYSQIIERINTQSTIRDKSQSVRASNAMMLPSARIDEQLKLLQEVFSGTKVIVLLLPYSPSIDKDHITFNDAENLQALKNSIEKNSAFFVIDPQRDFEHLLGQSCLPRGFANSFPGAGHLNKDGHIIVGRLLANKIVEIIP